MRYDYRNGSQIGNSSVEWGSKRPMSVGSVGVMRINYVRALSGMGRALKCAAAASALALAATGAAQANYSVGVAAYEQGQYDVAIDIWRRFALAGDVQSMKVLGDVYSGKTLEDSGDAADPLETDRKLEYIEALRWYTLAAYYRFNEDLRLPTPLERNAQILAEERLPKIRARMKDSEVKTATKLITDTFERGTAFDIYTLGEMYRGGAGVPKNNIRALELFRVAEAKGGVKAAPVAAAQLEKLMNGKEIEAANVKFAKWQPPLPEEHTGDTAQMAELKRVKKELQELRLADAMDFVSDIDVQLIQRALKSLGFYHGSVDNAMGPATRAAIRRFQYSQVKSDNDMTEEEKRYTETGVLSAGQTVDLFKKAAGKAEHPMSQYVYGIMHVRGIGVEKDGDAAVKWLKKASNEDLAIAHYALGVLYRDGTTGLNPVVQNKADAAVHFARSLALGYGPAGKALELLSFEKPRSVE